MNFGELTSDDKTGFKAVSKPNRVMNYRDRKQAAVTYELSLSIDVHDRRVYSFLDILSDVGGLNKSVLSIFFFIVVIFQYHGD